jgi:hypothetical protein
MDPERDDSAPNQPPGATRNGMMERDGGRVKNK